MGTVDVKPGDLVRLTGHDWGAWTRGDHIVQGVDDEGDPFVTIEGQKVSLVEDGLDDFSVTVVLSADEMEALAEVHGEAKSRTTSRFGESYDLAEDASLTAEAIEALKIAADLADPAKYRRNLRAEEDFANVPVKQESNTSYPHIGKWESFHAGTDFGPVVNKEAVEALKNAAKQDATQPDHYKFPGDVQVIDITKHLGFLEGNVVKYVARAGRKGDRVEDLKRALVYLNWAIEKAESVTETSYVEWDNEKPFDELE